MSADLLIKIDFSYLEVDILKIILNQSYPSLSDPNKEMFDKKAISFMESEYWDLPFDVFKDLFKDLYDYLKSYDRKTGLIDALILIIMLPFLKRGKCYLMYSINCSV